MEKNEKRNEKTLTKALPTLLIAACMVIFYAARDNLTEVIETEVGIFLWPLLHTDLEHLLGNLIAYLILSVPIILFLPFYVQLFTFILCSILGVSAHTLSYLAGYKYAQRVEGVSATVFGAFVVAAYALHSYESYNSQNMKLICGAVTPILLILILFFALITDASVATISQPAHIGGVLGGVILSL